MARIAPGPLAASRGRLTLFFWAALLALPCLLMTALGRDEERIAKEPQGEIAQTFTESERAEMRKAVEAVLPPQWFVVKTKADSTPPDWWCDDPHGGFLVECSNGSEVCRVWFLPLDWIGIRKVPNKAAKTYSWEGILCGSKYKTITHCDNDKLQEAMYNLFGGGMNTPSLTNAGWGRPEAYEQAEEIFAHRTEEADAVARRLIRKHCMTPDEFVEAAHSLIELGVPARTVFLRAARDVAGLDKSAFTGALGLMGGDDAIGVLCDVLSDSKAGDPARFWAAMALWEYTDKRIGPALHKALKEMSPGDVQISAVVLELGRIRYRPALPDLRKLAEQHLRKKDEPPREDSFEMAVLRIEGDWGKAGEERRYMLWLPPEVILGQPIQAAVYEENISSRYICFSGLDVAKNNFMINDKPLIEPGSYASPPFQGSVAVHSAAPGCLTCYTLDLAEHIVKPGRYKIRYGLGDVHSNEAVVVVPEAPLK